MKGDRWLKVEFAALLVIGLVSLWQMLVACWRAIAPLF
jgi:hypothetical protein